MQSKTAIYIRVSTHWQVDRDSLQVQRRELIAYSELVLNIPSYEVFEDPGYSAKNTDRPAYQQMMSRLRTGEFSHLLVWKIDRISRNLLDFASMYAELKTLGVIFVSKNEQFDTSSAIGEAMLKIILVFAELERKMIGERVTAVMLSRASEGKWNGGRPPLGYRVENDTVYIDQDEAEIYKLIANEYLSGKSLATISQELNDKNILRDGKQWSHVSVHRILRNDFYVGTYRYNVNNATKSKKNPKEEWVVIPDHHAPLITQEDFDAIQSMLSDKKRGMSKPGDTYTKKHTHIFAGLLRCGYCGSNMTSLKDHHRKKDNTSPSVYLCAKRKNGLDKCPNRLASDIVILPFVMTVVGNILTAKVVKNTSVPSFKQKILFDKATEKMIASDIPDEDVKEFLSSMKSKKLERDDYMPSFGENTGKREQLQSQRNKKELALSRLHSLYLYGEEGISEASYIIERTAIQKEIDEIDEELNKIPKTSERTLAAFAIMRHMLSEGIEYRKFATSVHPSIPKEFLNYIIDHIEVKDQRVEKIVFKNMLSLRFIY